MNRVDRVIALAHEINVKRKELADLETLLAKLVEGRASPRPRPKLKGTIVDRMQKLFRKHPRKVFTAAELLKAFPQENPKTIRGTVIRLSKTVDGGVCSVARAKWRAMPIRKVKT